MEGNDIIGVISLLVGIAGLVASIMGYRMSHKTLQQAKSIQDALNQQIGRNKIYGTLKKTVDLMNAEEKNLETTDPVNTSNALDNISKILLKLRTYNSDKEAGAILPDDLIKQIGIVREHMSSAKNISGGVGYWEKYEDEYIELRSMLEMEAEKSNVKYE